MAQIAFSISTQGEVTIEGCAHDGNKELVQFFLERGLPDNRCPPRSPPATSNAPRSCWPKIRRRSTNAARTTFRSASTPASPAAASMPPRCWSKKGWTSAPKEWARPPCTSPPEWATPSSPSMWLAAGADPRRQNPRRSRLDPRSTSPASGATRGWSRCSRSGREALLDRPAAPWQCPGHATLFFADGCFGLPLAAARPGGRFTRRGDRRALAFDRLHEGARADPVAARGDQRNQSGGAAGRAVGGRLHPFGDQLPRRPELRDPRLPARRRGSLYHCRLAGRRHRRDSGAGARAGDRAGRREDRDRQALGRRKGDVPQAAFDGRELRQPG